MQEEVNELLESFLALCLEQRQLTNNLDSSQRKEELEKSSTELAQKLYTKAAELERSGDISKGTFYIKDNNNYYSFSNGIV